MTNQSVQQAAEREPPRHREQTPDPTASRSVEAAPAYSPTLLTAPHLGERGNAAVRAAVMQRVQQTYGNRALQRFLQRGGISRPAAIFVQRQLIASGSDADFDSFRALVEPAIGQGLARDPATNQVTAVSSLATPATSPALLGILTRIMDDAHQNAEVNFGTHQARVAVGAFPNPSDMTGSKVQRIDMDDVQAIEAGAPGNGVAKLAHEINENYTAHASAPAAGVDRFGPAHAAGVAAESAVAQDLVGPGNRVAERDAPLPVSPPTFLRVQDFENYYLVFEVSNPSGADFTIANARQAARVAVSTYTIDQFASNSDAVPAGGAASIAAAAADLAAHTSATVLVEGFADSTGNAGINNPLSERRGEKTRDAIRAGGVAIGRGSFHVVGRGAAGFVAPNDTAANKALNRRVVITITEPAP